jgi:hypothetical protein
MEGRQGQQGAEAPKEEEMSAIDIRPVPGANGDIRKALEIIKTSVPKDTVVLCPYIGHIFGGPAEKV